MYVFRTIEPFVVSASRQFPVLVESFVKIYTTYSESAKVEGSTEFSL